MNSINVLIDLQYGSTGKGLLAGYLTTNDNYDTVMTAWGPNAGHTYIDAKGRKFVHIMLANGIVGPDVKRVMIGPGSILDLDILHKEINQCMDIILKNKMTIYVHPHAAVVTDENRASEQTTMTAIGSTKKGVGAAMCSKIQRQPLVDTVAKDFHDHPVFAVFDPEEDPVVLLSSPMEWFEVYKNANKILIEGAQGFGLSIQHGFYPYTTSRDVTPNQILADCGVPFTDACRAYVYGTARTYPIRVSNRYDADGMMVGYSGPGFQDQQEIGWDVIGVEPELTTVTKLQRRLFTFSSSQMAFANDICSPGSIFLNFVNYLKDRDQFADINDFLTLDLGVGEIIYGTGPTVKDVHRGLWGNSTKIWYDLVKIMEKKQ